jgi:ubiquinone/menaquinone biosynthesis C-methylase UbiE
LTQHKRFLSNKDKNFSKYLLSAKNYFSKFDANEKNFMYIKPLDLTPGNQAFYADMYSFLNLLEVMNIRPGGRVLEVGCGPGWGTELLVGAGFTVDALEPNEDFIQIASTRVASFTAHHHLSPARVNFHCATLEECTLQTGAFDGIFFYAALHHIIDEERGLAQCYRLLQPGGVLGVCEAAWVPGDIELERKLEQEMARFGTLENPFTSAYLDDLLRRYGFSQIVRYHQVNGLFPVGMESARLVDIARAPADGQNTLTAIKPISPGPTTEDAQRQTLAKISLIEKNFDRQSHRLVLKVRLLNQGETIWLHRPAQSGWVTLALRQGLPGSEHFREAAQRIHLPADVDRGAEMELVASFSLPAGVASSGWTLDLVNEGFFWFSARGTRAVDLNLF